MNCCDYDCNQGRNCPARMANKVAPIGKSYPRVIPTQSTEPVHMFDGKWRHLAKWLGLYLAMVALLIAVLGLAKKL